MYGSITTTTTITTITITIASYLYLINLYQYQCKCNIVYNIIYYYTPKQMGLIIKYLDFSIYELECSINC